MPAIFGGGRIRAVALLAVLVALDTGKLLALEVYKVDYHARTDEYNDANREADDEEGSSNLTSISKGKLKSKYPNLGRGLLRSAARPPLQQPV